MTITFKPADLLLAVALLLLVGVPFAGGVEGCRLPNVVAPSGPRVALIVHEQESDTAAWGAFVTALRDGEPSKYITEHKHSLLILDDDGKDENGQPSPFLAKFAPYKVPELLILSPPDKLLHREPLPADPKADAVLAALKANGG